MRKGLITSTFVLVCVLVLGLSAWGQTVMTQTTLSTSQDNTTATLNVASATGFAANTTVVFVDREAMAVLNVNGTIITVSRGIGGTKAAAHAGGVLAYVGPYSAFAQADVAGSCASTDWAYTPRVTIPTGIVSLCTNGQWQNYGVSFGGSSQMGVRGPNRICSVPVGSVAYASMGTDTATVAGTMFWINVEVPVAKTITGVSVLNGVTVGTNKWIAALYPAGGGAVLVNSAVAGATTAGANAFQDLAFTATYNVLPGRYWIGLQGNGTTDTFRSVAVSTFVDVLAKSATGTFATIPSLTVPTTLTADKGPIACLY